MRTKERRAWRPHIREEGKSKMRSRVNDKNKFQQEKKTRRGEKREILESYFAGLFFHSSHLIPSHVGCSPL